MPRQKKKDTRAALVQHFATAHFVDPAAAFAPPIQSVTARVAKHDAAKTDGDEDTAGEPNSWTNSIAISRRRTMEPARTMKAPAKPSPRRRNWKPTAYPAVLHFSSERSRRRTAGGGSVSSIRTSIDAAAACRLQVQDLEQAIRRDKSILNDPVGLDQAIFFSPPADARDHRQAAEICDFAVGKSRVSRGRNRLQAILKISGEADYGPDSISAQVRYLS
ncbi:hypothetical protein [Neomesorhizobium albiziae]|uniref:hypothetical protein n=1 Tax=Neomesorhizobium albiziae TaxID=335020 RepID=UPI001FCE4F5C|nr:hypothetical protein [Mesorhizobium albiziae]GLS30889.1 hypothetical protein GCM10007937_25980 [Mesorhizobium albiziae]